MKTRKVKIKRNITMKSKKTLDPYSIPIVIISWNQLAFLKNMVEKLKKYKNPIIILDNKSTYRPIFDYYKEIKKELGEKIEIKLLKENYGSNVYLKIKHRLPEVFILSDPDIEINKKMPENFAEILYNLSNTYLVYKVGLALELKDKDDFVRCAKKGNPLYEYQLKYWKERLPNKEYEIYRSPVDTTFCLVNSKYKIKDINPIMPAIRIAGNFTARHLPWYKNMLIDMIPSDELYMYFKNNKSSTFVRRCIRPMLRKTVKHNIRKDTLDENIKKINN
jgi:hypothetical protein